MSLTSGYYGYDGYDANGNRVYKLTGRSEITNIGPELSGAPFQNSNTQSKIAQLENPNTQSSIAQLPRYNFSLPIYMIR